LFAVLFIANNARAADQTPAGTDAAEKSVGAIEMRLGGRLGVAALDTGSSQRLEHRASERFPMCSTFKLLAVAAVLHRVDKKEEQLTRFVPYTKGDLLEYAPVTAGVSKGGMALAALCAAAVEDSDNTAANLCSRQSAVEGLTRYARSLATSRPDSIASSPT
jgi:beta-lactamase class A